MRPIVALLLFAVCVAVARPQTTDDYLKTIQPRSVGPAVTGGRIVDIEVHPAQPWTIFAASASGGLWKSVNNGTTWKPVFDDKKTVSIGDVAIAPSDPKVMWLGTGEHNNQRSAHYGDGVYKSTDGGETWQNMGLPNSNRIGRIAIDPKNPDVVYVASMGYLYKPGGERGVYKTSDGGKTWQLVLKGENDTTGFIEIVADPKNGNVVYAASLDRLRRAWNIRDYGVGSAIYKTTDGGRRWTKLSGGLPGGELGRIGLAIYPKNPKILYATVINRAPNTGVEIYRTDDAGAKWKKVNEDRVDSSSYYGQIRVDPTDPQTVYSLGVQAYKSKDGGKKWSRIDRQVHVDHHALWIDPSNPKRLLLGNDGGLYTSYDEGDTWLFVNNLPVAQFYTVSADNAFPYNVMGGLQDNGSWRGPSRSRIPSGIQNWEWINVSGGDGFVTFADPQDPETIYTSSQFGAVTRYDARRRTSRGIRPRAPEGTRLRSNWLTPFFASPWNSKTLYLGTQLVHKSTDRGDNWTIISPDLTTNNEEKIKGNVPHCTITTLDESPAKAGVLWAGTDDGNVWVTQDDGKTWTQVNANIPGAPKEWWVSRVHASPHDAGTAFVSYTGFREDDFTPMLWKTTDFGKTWTSIVGDLPQEQIAVVKQDRINPDLLFVGTETSAHVSMNGGRTWNRIPGMPTVAVQDLVIQEREGELVLGTHGRGIYIADIRPLREANAATGKPLYVFRPATALAYSMIGNMFDAFNGMLRYAATNPPSGSAITYFLAEDSAEDVKVQILDKEGKVIREMTGPKSKGINTVRWDVRGAAGFAAAGSYRVKVIAGSLTGETGIEVVDWQR